jgi:hypothetical protein
MLSNQKRNHEHGYQKHWCFTFNNYTEQEARTIDGWIRSRLKTSVKKAIIGREEAPSTGTKHLQGYVAFIQKWSGWQVARLWGGKAHWEPARASEQKNREYCEKEGNLLLCVGFNKKEKTEQKEIDHDRWNRIVRDAMSMGPEEFAETWPKEWIIRRSAIERLMLDSAKKNMRVWGGNLQWKNIWMWGGPGIGKSKWAHEQQTGGKTLKKNVNKWWDGMDVSSVTKVIIEDFPCTPNGDMMAYYMKLWGDRYVFTGEVKNSALAIDPGRFFLIVTSNYGPKSCFSREEDLKAIERRFAVLEMTRENRTLLNRMRLDPEILERREIEEEEEEQEGEEGQEITVQEAIEALATPVSIQEEQYEEW